MKDGRPDLNQKARRSIAKAKRAFWKRWREENQDVVLCSVFGCDRSAGKTRKSTGLCPLHYKRWYRYGDPYITHKGANGTGCVTDRGYILIGNRYEHRRIMDVVVGRRLSRDEVVHHKNGNKSDNRIANLEVLPNAEHSRMHAKARYAS